MKRQRLGGWIASASLLLLVGGCSSTGAEGPVAVDAVANVASTGPAPAQGAEYRISRQDTLEVAVYGVPDLSRSLEVDGSGQINMPLLGGVMAAGKTVRDLEAELARRLKARYLQSPQVSVFVKDAIGQRLTVDGAVKTPGVVSAKGDTTLLRALAQAGGFSDTADLSAVTVFRPTASGKVATRYDAAAIRSGKAADPPVYGGDTIIVDESAGKTTWKTVREVLPVAGVLRPF